MARTKVDRQEAEASRAENLAYTRTHIRLWPYRFGGNPFKGGASAAVYERDASGRYLSSETEAGPEGGVIATRGTQNEKDA